jgi:hypothetical protein
VSDNAVGGNPKQGKLLPAFDLTELPRLEIPDQFVSKHANAADYAIHRVTSV